MKPVSVHNFSAAHPGLGDDAARLRFAMTAAGVGIWELDTVTSEVIWDDRCRELFGIAQDNKIPFSQAVQYIHPDDRDAVVEAVHKALAGENDGRYDIHYRIIGASDKKLRSVHFSGQAYFDDAGKPVRFGGIVQDLTEYADAMDRLRAEEVDARSRLVETQKVLEHALHLAKLATWTINAKTGQVEYSERMKHWLGISESERYLDIGIKALNSGEREPVKAAMQWAMNTGSGGVFDMEYSITNQMTGRQRVIHSQARTFFNADGEAVKITGVSQDVTQQRNVRLALEHEVQQRTEELDAANEELKAINEELHTANDQLHATNEELEALNGRLEQSNEDLQQFAHVASHDLKEPVRKIKTFLGIIEADPETVLSAKTKLLLERVYSASDRMFSMINGVLKYSTINASGHPITKVDLRKVVEQVLQDIEMTVEQKKATVTCNELPTVEGAETLLYQLFSNLIINALKFTNADMPPVITITASEGNSHLAKITVEDNGIGFAPEQAEKIFNMFARLHSKDKFEGTGLGLALCRKIVHRHGGTIGASGVAGKGAIFSIILPVTQNEDSILI